MVSQNQKYRNFILKNSPRLGTLGPVISKRSHDSNSSRNSRLPESPSMIGRLAVHNVTLGARTTGDWPVPTVTNSSVKITRVETLKTLVQRHPALHACIPTLAATAVWRAVDSWSE